MNKQQSTIRCITLRRWFSKKKKEKGTDHMGVSQFSIFLSLYTLEINAITFLRAHVSSKTTRPSRVAGYPHYVFIRDFLWTIGRQEVVAQMHKVRFRSRGINWPRVFPCGPRRQEAPSATNLEQFRFQTDRNREERRRAANVASSG